MPPPITPKSRPSARSAYVALGSSFASGPGIDPLIDPSSSRSGANYPRIVAASLDLALTDVSCGGATVNDIVNGDRSGRPAQIDAVTADAALVTLTVGGNDIQYLPQLIRATYQHQPAPLDATLARIPDDLRRLITPMLCTPVTADDRRATADAVGGLAARLADLLTDIQRRAPRSRVLVVDYLSILPNPAQPVPLPLLDEELAYFTDIAAQAERDNRTRCASGQEPNSSRPRRQAAITMHGRQTRGCSGSSSTTSSPAARRRSIRTKPAWPP